MSALPVLATDSAAALAPVIPLMLTALTRGTGTPPSSRPAPDRSDLWLRNAAAGLCILAAAAAAVSFTAQYRMVDATRHLPAIAALEAAIPDAAALVFACLGIALASDTLIGVVRAWALARHQHLVGDAATPLAILGGLLLWLLRLALAPASTLAGFRAWVLAECPVAPGRRPAPAPHPRKATKTARFLDLVTERHGPLASLPLDRVAGISATLAPLADLNPGAARTALRKAVLAARNGDPR
jgi:hypothetical protein